MEESPTLGKRKLPEENSEVKQTPKQEESASKRRNLTRTCVHEAAVPVGYTSNKDESAHGTLSSPVIMEIWASLLWIGTRITRIL